MDYRINRKNFMYMTANVFMFVLVLVVALICGNSKSENVLIVLGYLNILLFIWYLYSWKKLGNRLFSPYIIFITFTYIFHYGQIILYSVGLGNYIIDTRIRANVINIFPIEIAINSVLFCTFSIFMFHTGALVYCLKNRSYKSIISKLFYNKSDINLCRGIGIFTLIISIYPTLKFDLAYISAALSKGYTAVFELDINYGLWDDLARMYKVAMFFLILGYKDKPKTALGILAINVIYSFTKMMMIGQRGYEMIFLIVLIWLYIISIGKFKLKHMLLLSAFGIFSSAFLSLAVAYRDGIERFGIEHIMNYILNNNPLLMAISEFGGTLYTVQLYMELVPEQIKYGYGNTYILSLFTVLPNIGGVLGPIPNLASPNYILSQLVPRIGGSYIGEFFYNFGWFGMILGLFFGYIFAKFSKGTDCAIQEKRYVVVAISATILNVALWTVRDSFSTIPRNLLFQLILPIFGYWILLNLLRKNSNLKGREGAE
jgi:hypothetical protein